MIVMEVVRSGDPLQQLFDLTVDVVLDACWRCDVTVLNSNTFQSLFCILKLLLQSSKDKR